MKGTTRDNLKTWGASAALAALFFVGIALWQGSHVIERLMGPLTVEQILFHLLTPIEGVSGQLAMLQRQFLGGRAILSLAFLLWCGGAFAWLSARCRGWRRAPLWLALAALAAYALSFFRLYRDSLVVGVALAALWLLEPAWGLLGPRLEPWVTRYRRQGGRLYVAFLVVLVTLIGMVMRVERQHGLWDYLSNRFRPSEMLDSQYVEASEATYEMPGAKRNLVLVVSESLERTYGDKTLFGKDLIPELTRLATAHPGFRGQIEVNGTDNTIASITAMLYGVPRLLVGREGWHNHVSGNMFSGSTSILHVLHRQGYRLVHLQGGSARFADTAALYEDFPDAIIIDNAQLQHDPEYERLRAEGHHYDWGVNDRIMLKHARRQYERLVADGRPFVLIISTIDTHYDGYVEGLRTEANQMKTDYVACVRAQSRLLGEFADWLSQQPSASETVLAIIGDHYVMRNYVGATRMWLLTNGTTVPTEEGRPPQRTVFSSLVNDAPPTEPPSRERLFASFDWAPTLLEAVGVRWASRRFGVGVSLYSGEPTLLERVGGATYERESRRVSTVYRRLVERAQRVHQSP